VTEHRMWDHALAVGLRDGVLGCALRPRYLALMALGPCSVAGGGGAPSRPWRSQLRRCRAPMPSWACPWAAPRRERRRAAAGALAEARQRCRRDQARTGRDQASRKQTRADARAHAHISAPRVRRAMFGLRMQEAEPVNREQVNPEP
jgi:hypothetical protein